jgi:hypothetical protein
MMLLFLLPLLLLLLLLLLMLLQLQMQALADKLRSAMLLRAEESLDLENDTSTISGYLEEQLNVSTCCRYRANIHSMIYLLYTASTVTTAASISAL